MAYWHSYKPYVPVHERRANAFRNLSDRLEGKTPQPIVSFKGRKMAQTFWGEAWNENLESYSDFENRLPRGRTYTRNGSIVHLEISPGEIQSYVAGSDLYQVKIKIAAFADVKWAAFKTRCAGRIDTLLELLQGRLSDAVIAEITDRETGLFPAPDEIELQCSCPDWATMCKHVAAVLYGVGVRLDSAPNLFFLLRGVNHEEIFESASVDTLEDSAFANDEEILQDTDLGSVFGIEFSDLPSETSGRVVKKMRAARKR